MANAIEYALMAGRVYQSTRGQINWLPDLLSFGWTEFLPQQEPSGFEAISFRNGNEIVISFAGTGSAVDWWANAGGFFGVTSEQLEQAADYYLQVKTTNPNATISFTGHSLGGGLASLLAVFFGETAVTFDQAPFRGSASVAVANTLLSYLSDPARGYSAQDLQGLTNFISAAANGGIPNEGNVLDISVQGEILDGNGDILLFRGHRLSWPPARPQARLQPQAPGRARDPGRRSEGGQIKGTHTFSKDAIADACRDSPAPSSPASRTTSPNAATAARMSSSTTRTAPPI